MKSQCICVVCKKQFVTQWKTATCGNSVCRESLGSTEEERFFFDRLIKTESGCWEWLGGKDKCGNPVVNLGRGKCVTAWKYAKKLLQGVEVGNKRYTKECKNQFCVNPEHLMSDWDRLQSRIVVNENGCHIWTAAKDDDGYAVGWLDGKQGRVARILWEKENGPIEPKTLQICHVCDNPPCVNLGHCFLGTAKDNSDDKRKKSRESRGVRSNVAVLNDETVAMLRVLTKSGLSVAQAVSRLGLNCSESAACSACTGKTWSHVEEPAYTPGHEIKLSPEIAENIRKLRASGKRTGEIALLLDLDVCRQTIESVIRGESWRHVS